MNFTSSIDSELGDNDVQYFPYILNCTDFSPSVSVSLSTTNCDYLSDLTITVSQDLFEVDMDTATFISDGGFFLLSSVNNGDTIGTATMSLNLSSFNTNLIVSNIISSNEITVEAIDQLTGAVLGSFTIKNIIGGGIEIMAISPDDGNLYTYGNFSSITFVNLFQTPDSSSVIFSSNIISELADTSLQIHPFLLNCQISPTVSVLLSDLNCGLTDLTIVVSQDSNEVDIDTAFFISDGGFFVISSMNVGDNIGFADMVLSSSILNADLVVNNIVSPNELIVEAIDQITGAILGTFFIFLPGFLLMYAFQGAWINLISNPLLSSISAKINAAVVGLLIAALYQPVATSAISTPVDMAFVLVGIFLIQSKKIPIFWLVLFYGLIGFLHFS